MTLRFDLLAEWSGPPAFDGDRGIDILVRIVVSILAFSQSHARWSIDAWVRRRIGRPTTAASAT